jgi:hypothetical protein
VTFDSPNPQRLLIVLTLVNHVTRVFLSFFLIVFQDYEWVISDEDHPKLEPRLLPGEKIHTQKQTFAGWLFLANCQVVHVNTVGKIFLKNKMLAPARRSAQTRIPLIM